MQVQQALSINYDAIMPEVMVSVAGMIVLLYGAFTKQAHKDLVALNILGLAGAGVACGKLWQVAPLTAFSGMVVIDHMALSFMFIFLIVAALTTLASLFFLESEDHSPEEYCSLIMFSTVGMMLMACAGDMVMIFLGLEIASISTYVMAGYRRTDLRSNESALKYFILGSFSTAFLLYGMALIYGATGSTNLDAIRNAIKASTNLATNQPISTEILFIGAAMMLVGFGFKIATAPFHIWTPDVYEGAPTPVTAFMATGSKAAAFVAIMRVFVMTFSVNYSVELHMVWVNVLQALAILTMIIGNVIALTQTNIKRMLAYSSIAHAGYALLGLLSDDWSSVAFYMLSYAIMNIGAFTIISALAGKGDERTDLNSLAGVGFKSLGLSIALLIFMLSMAGFPLTAGFIGKFLVFRTAWNKGFHAPVIVAVLSSAISVYYYLRPMVIMFFRDSHGSHGHAGSQDSHDNSERPAVAYSLIAAIVIALLGTFYLGLMPGRLLDLLANASQVAMN